MNILFGIVVLLTPNHIVDLIVKAFLIILGIPIGLIILYILLEASGL
jgi:hypothetical protein